MAKIKSIPLIVKNPENGKNHVVYTNTPPPEQSLVKDKNTDVWMGLNEWGVAENPSFDKIGYHIQLARLIENDFTKLTKNPITNKDFVESYKNAPREDDYLDKYRAKLIGKWANRRLKLKLFFKRILNF